MMIITHYAARKVKIQLLGSPFVPTQSSLDRLCTLIPQLAIAPPPILGWDDNRGFVFITKPCVYKFRNK